ncbi:hypothetical protein FO519_005403 [Halicephalobus sp. NKZ332]|nr:hypothetical protein FO519_005403 [Halicephalobus sp. NKZ332]
MSSCKVTSLKTISTVYISKLKGIYENLAIEEWLFRNHNLETEGDLLLLWTNNPAVVIGRHQNPFLEANVPFLEKEKINLARRHSGGGTVFHGFGNLNISLLTSHKDHCRPRNLNWIADTLNSALNTKVIATKRDDLIFSDERKISGTAARIARNRAYHHLTLLISEDLELLRQSLKSPWKDMIETNATRSVPAKHVGQLSQEVPGITIEEVQMLLIESFVKKFQKSKCLMIEDFDEASFPGINSKLSELVSWEWIIAKTPKFTFKETVKVEQGKITASGNPNFRVGEKFVVS